MEVQSVEFSQSQSVNPPLPALNMSHTFNPRTETARSPRRNFSKTSPAQHSKSARSPRFGNTKNNRRLNPVLSMSQRICPEVQKVSVQFAILSQYVRKFLTENSIPTLNPNLPNLYSALSLAYDTYCHQCTMMFSNVTRTPAQRNYHQGSPIFVQGKLLMMKWVQFIEEINKMVDTDVEPYRNKIHQYVMEYKSAIRMVIGFAKKTQYYPAPLVHQLRQICKRADRCEERLNDFFDPIKRKEQTPDLLEDINQADITPQHLGFYKLLEATATLFEQTLPKDVMPIREAVRQKSRSINSCAMVIEVLNDIEMFHSNISKIKTQIVSVNTELNFVHQQLNLPFCVTLTIEGEKFETKTQ